MATSYTRSLVIGCLSLPLTVLAFLMGYLIGGNWKMGAIAALGTIAIFYLISAINLFFVKEIGWIDLFMPIPLSIAWSLIFMLPPVAALNIDPTAFRMPCCIGAGFLLTLNLWLWKSKRISKTWLIFPILILGYEMLPVNFPTAIDDILALGGTATNAFLVWLNGDMLVDGAIRESGQTQFPVPQADSPHELEE